MNDIDTCRAVVVAPTYNNASTLESVLNRVFERGIDVIVVNDGSTDDTAQILERMDAAFRDATSDSRSCHLTILHHAENRGKAEALRTGFAEAARLGFTHAVTLDTDDQHEPEQIPRLLRLAKQYPHSLILGVRSERTKGYPTKSLWGRRLSNLMVWAETGQNVSDSQSGFRVYPLGLIEAVPCHGGRYEFETEILTRAAWAGCKIIETPIRSQYLPADRRVTHFRPVWDSLRGIFLHVRLIGRRLVPWPRPSTWPVDVAPTDGSPENWRQRLWTWINPVEMWRQIRDGETQRTRIAAGVAMGVFIANLPIYPLQTLASLYAAKRLHLHPVSVLLGASLSMPPIFVPLIMAAIVVGHFILHGELPVIGYDYIRETDPWKLFQEVLAEWVVGGVILGIAMAPIAFVCVMWLTRQIHRDPS